MNSKQLLIGSVIRTVCVSLELAALIIIAVITFSNDGTGSWGYWGSCIVVFGTLSPIIIYVIASAIFNAFNMKTVIKKSHTARTVKKYRTISIVFLIWGIVTGSLYGFLLVPLFLLENISLFIAYQNEATQ